MRQDIRTKDNIEIRNIPEGTSDTVLKQMIASLRGSQGAGNYNFQTVAQHQAKPRESATSMAGTPEQQEQLQSNIELRRREHGTTAEKYVETPPEAKTTLKGTIDSFLRGAGPMLTAGATGAVAGSVVPGVGTAAGAGIGMGAYAVTEIISPFIANFLNDKFDAGQMSAQEAYTEMYNQLGVENPDTKAEMLAQSVGKNIGDAVAVVTGAGAVGTGQKLGSTVTGRIAEQLAYKPLSQIVGAGTGTVTAEYGGQGAEKLAELAGAGETGQAVANVAGQFVGGAAGDILGGAAMSPIEKRMAARRTPMATESAQNVRAAQELGEELTTDELMRSSTDPKYRTQKEITHAQARETTRGGSGQMHYDRFLGNQKKLSDEMREFGIEVGDLGNTPRFAEDLMNDFLDTRKARLDEFVGNKREVIDRLSVYDKAAGTGGHVDTANTVDLIDEIRADLLTLDQQEFGSFGIKLNNWMDNIQGKNLKDVERYRKIIGDYIADPEAIPSGQRKEVTDAVNKIYASLRENMGDYIESTGGTPDYNKWAVANANLKGMAEDFESKALFKLFEEGNKNPDNIDYDSIFNILTGPNISNARMTYDRLSPEGKGIAKMSIMADIFKEANPRDISPNVYTAKLQDRAEAIGIVLDPDELERMTGLKRFFEATAFSEDFVRRESGTRRLDTGQVIGSGPLVAHGMRKIGPIGLAIGAISEATIGKAAQKFERPEMRNLMASMAEVDPGSAAEAELVKRIMRIIGATPESETGEQTERVITSQQARRDQRGAR